MTAHLPLHLLPVFLGIWLPLSFIITYIMAISYHHIYPIWPTISNTGALAPESCVFSLLVNGATVLYGVVMYVRHAQLLEYSRCRPKNGPGCLLIYVSSTIGFIACLGLWVDANFQETSFRPAHVLGASVSIYASTIYYIFQTLFSYWMIPEMNSLVMFFLRTAINVLNVGFMVASFIAHSLGAEYFKGKTIQEYMNWSPSMAGWPFKVATSGLEWLIVLCFVLYVLTFYPDFKRIQLKVPVVQPGPVKDDAPFLISYSTIRNSFRYPEHRKRQDQSTIKQGERYI